MEEIDYGRRAMFGFAAVALTGLANPVIAAPPPNMPRTIELENAHTGEFLSRTYFAAGRYIPEALRDISVLLRDHRTGDVHDIDPRLLDILFFLGQRLDSEAPFEVISGYRSPKTNAMLAANSTGVATKSLHMEGKAIDVTMSGKSIRRLRDMAISLGAGGVGYYPESRFIHVDTGEVRYW